MMIADNEENNYNNETYGDDADDKVFLFVCFFV